MVCNLTSTAKLKFAPFTFADIFTAIVIENSSSCQDLASLDSQLRAGSPFLKTKVMGIFVATSCSIRAWVAFISDLRAYFKLEGSKDLVKRLKLGVALRIILPWVDTSADTFLIFRFKL